MVFTFLSTVSTFVKTPQSQLSMFLQLYCNIMYLGASYKPLCSPEPVTLHGLSLGLLLLNHNTNCFSCSPSHFCKVPFKVRIPRSLSAAISSCILTIYIHQRPPYHLHCLPLGSFPFSHPYFAAVTAIYKLGG